MSEPLDYTARIKAKGLDGTGVSETHAKGLAGSLGASVLLIVEASADTLITHADGRRTVQLGLTMVEPVPEEHEETVRRFMRSLFMARPEQQGQAVLRGVADEEPSVSDAAAGLAAALPEGGQYDDFDSPDPDDDATVVRFREPR